MNKPKPIPPGKYSLITVYPAWNPIALKLRPGDVFLTWLDTDLAKGIIILTAFFSPDREAKYNHAGIISGFGGWSLEALWHLESKCMFEQHEGKKILIFRWNKVTDEAVLNAHLYTNKHIGQFYPVHRLVLHLFNMAHIFHWKRLVCSEYAAKYLKGMGARKRRYYGTTPDHLDDEAHHMLNAERTGPKYDIIKERGLPYNHYKYCFNCKTLHLIPFRIKKCPKCNSRLTYNFLEKARNETLKLAHQYNIDKKKWLADQIRKKIKRKKIKESKKT